jgi:hypothetical protein
VRAPRNIVQSEIDKKLDPEKRLIKQCLRCASIAEMEPLLQEAFRTRARISLGAGDDETSSDQPLVPPPQLIDAMTNLKLNFGNVGEDERGFADKVDMVIAAAEKVATALYGANASPREQQERAWKEHGASVWDLEAMEHQALAKGEEVPWANDAYDHMLPQLEKGAKQGEFKIGGN